MGISETVAPVSTSILIGMPFNNTSAYSRLIVSDSAKIGSSSELSATFRVSSTHLVLWDILLGCLLPRFLLEDEECDLGCLLRQTGAICPFLPHDTQSHDVNTQLGCGYCDHTCSKPVSLRLRYRSQWVVLSHTVYRSEQWLLPWPSETEYSYLQLPSLEIRTVLELR